MLGPALFLIYINDIDDGIASRILKFADDTKLFGRVGNSEDLNKMREDLVKLGKWSREWLMLFNVEKCKVMHVGFNNSRAHYVMDGEDLQPVTEELDLGVIVQDDLKCTKQCVKVVGNANRVLGMIRRTFGNMSVDVVMQLYKGLVRPRLEYAVQAWRPHLRKDIELIEKVQRRATRMVKGMARKDYEERLRQLKMTTLETRRLRGDLILVFKIFRGMERIKSEYFFVKAEGSTRGHDLKLVKPQCRLDCRKYSFSNRVITEWNKLPGDVIACSTVTGFKRKIDRYLLGQGFI